MDLLRKWCNRGVLLEHGQIAALGNVDEVIAAYTKAMSAQGNAVHGRVGAT